MIIPWRVFPTDVDGSGIPRGSGGQPFPRLLGTRDPPACGKGASGQGMMTSSNGIILRVTGLCAGIHRSPVNSPHKGK